jgi:hypothetical protein
MQVDLLAVSILKGNNDKIVILLEKKRLVVLGRLSLFFPKYQSSKLGSGSVSFWASRNRIWILPSTSRKIKKKL